jgi:prevent-host-death family protein
MTITIKSEEARNRWRDMMDAVMGGESVVIERYNTPRAALISYEDFVALHEAIEELQADRRAAEIYERLRTGETTTRPWEDVQSDLIEEGLLDER